MSLAQVGEALSHAQPAFIIVVVASVLGSLVTRAARWQVYFLPRRNVAFGPALSTLSISYMASTFLPLRAGELVRAVFLGQRERIPIPVVIGTILVEKLFDFLAIGVLLALLVAITPLPAAAQVAAFSITSVILFGFAFVVALAIWRRPTLVFVGMVEKLLPFGVGPRLRLQEAARDFAEGTDSLQVPTLWVGLLGWTAVTWLFSIGTTWAGTLALGIQPGFAAILFVVVLTSTGQAVPSSPGYVGVYHAASVLALTAFGLDPATALGIALITHAFSYGTLVIAGMIALWTGGYSFDDMLKGTQSQRTVSPATVPAEL
ncbi:MAG: flippase-like domain-containing protein [Chloroflexi bacterium]|nr:flippase-like domain-containing protein [Chloroflexota bacterium]